MHDRGWCTACITTVDQAMTILARVMSFAPLWLAFDRGALAMQAECARMIRAFPDRTKSDSTVWRIDSVLADILASHVEGIYPEDLEVVA